MMQERLLSLSRCQSGAAGAEMALLVPLLMILMFGSFEMGNYFYSEHVVIKSVRDGARFASRSFPFDVDCSSSGLPAATVQNIKTVTRTGKLSGGTTRLAGWTDDGTITVAPLPNTDSNLVGKGIYKDRPNNVCTVRVTATVPYVSLFGTLGLSGGNNLFLKASSEAPVVGL